MRLGSAAFSCWWFSCLFLVAAKKKQKNCHIFHLSDFSITHNRKCTGSYGWCFLPYLFGGDPHHVGLNHSGWGLNVSFLRSVFFEANDWILIWWLYDWIQDIDGMIEFWMGWCDGHLEDPVVRGMEREVVPDFFIYFLSVLVFVGNGEGDRTFAARLWKSLPSPSPNRFVLFTLTGLVDIVDLLTTSYVHILPWLTNQPNLLHLISFSSLLSFFLSTHFLLFFT